MLDNFRNAVIIRNCSVVARLLAEGRDIDKRDRFGQTALMLAAQNGHAELAKQFVDAGENVNFAEAGYRVSLARRLMSLQSRVVCPNLLITWPGRGPESSQRIMGWVVTGVHGPLQGGLRKSKADRTPLKFFCSQPSLEMPPIAHYPGSPFLRGVSRSRRYVCGRSDQHHEPAAIPSLEYPGYWRHSAAAYNRCGRVAECQPRRIAGVRESHICLVGLSSSGSRSMMEILHVRHSLDQHRVRAAFE